MGWIRFPADDAIAAWVKSVAVPARTAADHPENAHWWRHGRTWFVGVDALGNDATGSVNGGPPLAGRAVDFIRNTLGLANIASHRGQVSICTPGYPKRDPGESEQAHRYRMKRAAAHVDGLHGEGPHRRRHLRELHDFILGIPIDDIDTGASPFVIWEGSHHIMKRQLRENYGSIAPERWGDIDITETYHAARQRVFETCRRTDVTARSGECYLVHRFALHGVAPWQESKLASRTVVYFRPCQLAPEIWLRGD
ncbi:MAG: hypothetical protein ACKVP5_01300 [Aestuariivirga sp.]